MAYQELLHVLKIRFDTNMDRHMGIQWADVQDKLESNTERLWALNEMERTGGEPDVVGWDEVTGKYIFCDCSEESPKGQKCLLRS